MRTEPSQEREERLSAMFGTPADFSYDEETETNMIVRLDISTLDHIVAIAYADPRLVAN